MPADNRLELVVEVDTRQANASIKGVNASLSSMEQAAVRAAGGAARGIDGLTASMTKAVIAGQAIYNAVLSAARALKSLAMGALETQDEIAKTAQRIGVSTEHLSELRHMAGLSGLSFEELSTAIARFARNAAKGSDVLAALGVSTRNADRSSRDMMAILEDLAGRFAAMPDDMQKTALAIELFGRGGARMIPLLNQGAAGLRELRREARELGVVVDESMARQAEHLRDNLERLRTAITGLAFELLRQLTPSLVEATDRTIRWIREGGLERLAGYIRQAAEWVRNLGEWIVTYAVVKGLLELAAAARSAAVAFGAMNAAAIGNPFGLIAAGAATAGMVLMRERQKLDEWTESLEKAGEKAAIWEAFARGATLKDLEAKGYTRGQIARGIGGPESRVEAPRRGLQVDLEELEQLERRRKEMAEAEKRAADILRRAREEEMTGPARLAMEHRRYLEELGKTEKARQYLEEAFWTRVSAMARKELQQWAASRIEAIEAEYAAYRDFERERLLRAREFANETLELHLETARKRMEFDERLAELARDRELEAARAAAGDDLASKLELEARRAAIEEQYLEKRLELRKRALAFELELEIANMEAIARARGIAEEEIARRREAIAEVYAQREAELEIETRAAIEAARQSAAARQAELVRDHNQRVFDSLKRQAEGVFDALLTRSRSVWQAIADSLKTAILTAIKEIVTSRVAALLMQLLAGMRVPVAASGAGSMAAVGALGALPALGAGPIAGGAVGGWGTPPFIPAGAGGFGSLGGWLRSGGWMDLATAGGLALMLGGLARRNAALTILGASLGLARLGIHGTQLGMVGGAGAGLALAGLMRGGLGGFAMSTAGGAILGWQFGGPLGAAIGAGIGAIAGLFRSLFKSAEEKAREKIRATYGVDIRDKAVLRQIVEMAKQAFAGNLAMAIRSPQVRDLIELYALSTGQSTAGLPATVKPVTLAQQGGILYQAVSGSLDRIGSGTAQQAGPIVINITVPGAKEFFENETLRVVVDNPRAVQSSTLAAARANAGRRELLALQLAPGTLLS